MSEVRRFKTTPKSCRITDPFSLRSRLISDPFPIYYRGNPRQYPRASPYHCRPPRYTKRNPSRFLFGVKFAQHLARRVEIGGLSLGAKMADPCTDGSKAGCRVCVGRTLRLILGKLVLLPEFGLAFRCWRRKRVIMRLQMQNYKKYCIFARLWAEKITESCKIVCKYGKFFVHLQQILRQKPYKHIRLTPLYNYLCHNHHRPARAQPSTRRLVL